MRQAYFFEVVHRCLRAGAEMADDAGGGSHSEFDDACDAAAAQAERESAAHDDACVAAMEKAERTCQLRQTRVDTALPVRKRPRNAPPPVPSTPSSSSSAGTKVAASPSTPSTLAGQSDCDQPRPKRRAVAASSNSRVSTGGAKRSLRLDQCDEDRIRTTVAPSVDAAAAAFATGPQSSQTETEDEALTQNFDGDEPAAHDPFAESVWTVTLAVGEIWHFAGTLSLRPYRNA